MSAAGRAAELVRAAPPRLGGVRLVAVDGPSGSGKTVFARRLVAELTGLAVALVPTDDFATWDDPVDWWPRLATGVLDPLRRGEPGGYRRIEWPDGRPRPGARVAVPVPDVLVVEGMSAARREVAPELSLTIWVELPDPALRLERAVARDGEQTRAELRRWQHFEHRWFPTDDTRTRADLVIDAPHLTDGPE
ncbi:hypothetical protein [Saccharopolyspora cebuensis]|uniref:Uridine kinase n=1 Tax=Saccharopolyspora cebuensis TaxID=418759 RepID=A0ABV4CU85_9PSEU